MHSFWYQNTYYPVSTFVLGIRTTFSLANSPLATFIDELIAHTCLLIILIFCL